MKFYHASFGHAFAFMASFGVVTLTSAPLQASTLSVNFNVNGLGISSCDTVEANGSTTTCRASNSINGQRAELTMQTRTDDGNIGIGADLVVSGTGDPNGTSAFFSSRVSVTFSDTISFAGVDNGVFVVPLDLAGSTFAPAPSTSPDFVGVIGNSGTDFQFTSIYKTVGGGFDENFLYREQRSGTTFINEPADNTLTDIVGSTGITNLLFPIIDGQTELSVNMQGGVSCGGRFTAGTPCRASIDFLNSARFLGGSVKDANGNAVAGVAISSASGFDYAAGVAPHTITPVPLPASGLMLLAGIFGLGGFCRSRSTS